MYNSGFFEILPKPPNAMSGSTCCHAGFTLHFFGCPSKHGKFVLAVTGVGWGWVVVEGWFMLLVLYLRTVVRFKIMKVDS